ncbi:unnamed protein product, partial [Mesorhabditis belari]|uniref:Ig-like domain-containing protein n=1 Tax=Mesorhabditis belari TaxID=2138241 RepID=A0AAF3FIN6_9BILA
MNFTNLDERFSLMNDRQQLHIEEATPQDAGRYSCVAENRQGRAEKDLTVEILKPPKMTDKQHQREVLEGQSLTLQCPIEDQTAEITWTKHGVPITTSQRLQMSIGRDKLHIMGAESSDMAQYSCTAKNLAGEDSSNFNVTVATPPKILSPAFRQLDVIMNQTVEIDCETTGTPSPTIEWTRDGKTLQNQPNIKIDENGKVLRIVGVKESDAGRYSCKAENKAGQAEADTFISVISPPQVSMVADEQKVIASHGITIRCEVFGNPQPEVEWQKNGQPFTQGILQSQTFIHIQDAKPEDAGRYTCIGTNRAGEQRASTQLHVLTPPSIENEERLLQVKEGSDLTIDCAASGNPTPTISWKRDGVLIKNQNSSKLLISSANATDAGKYTCEARNEAGVARADFAVDVLIKPRFKDAKKVIKVINGENARLECKAEGHPTPTIKWLKGGRPLDVEEMDNLILSPRGETLMIVKTKRADAGSYSCVAKNAAGEAEHPFTVEVLTPPHIDETIDQNPRVVQGKDLVFMCPVLGNPDPKVEWLKDGQSLKIGGRFKVNSGKHLQIEKSSKADEARYTCHAKNDAGVLDTDFKPEVIAPPKFNRTGESVYEVIAGETIVMDCAVATEPKPEVLWFRGDNALVLTNQMQLSPDSMQLTIRQAALADGGKYVCRATNEAGSSDIDLILKVLIPPKIDRSNIIGNPLAIVNKSIVLECPVNGIPQPSVIWTIDGKPIDPKDTRIKLHQKNQTISIDRVKPTDQARFTCIATNKGGQTDQDFHLEVLNPPHLDSSDSQKLVKREGEVVTMVCPVRSVLDGSEPTEVSWIKDGRPVDHSQEGNIKLTSDNRRLTIQSATLSDAGAYTCVAMNRAGESTLDFSLEILSPPSIDTSKGTETSARVIVGNTAQLLCPVSGHPFPTVKWTKDGKEMIPSDNVRVIDSGQILEILNARPEDEGRWICTAENDAGTKDLEIELDVWVPPKVAVHSENPTKALGQSVIINCNVSGNPTPRISWTKGGAPILIDNLNTRISLKGTRLDIPKLERNDVGIYTCVAENEAGTAEASITVDVLVPPVISRDNIDMSPRLPTGQTLTLNCDGGGKPTPKLRWFVNDTELTTSNGDILIGTDNKYIQINNITLEDRGLYKCVAENVAGNDTLLYNVDVVQSPTIQNGGTQQVIEGDTAIIECAADGHPAPIVSWLRNGVRLETGITGVRYHAEGSTLKVVDARSSDSGIYVCQATNEAGTAQQAYTLEVLVSPKITTTSPEMGSVPLGQPFSLKCGVKGYPDPQIIWTLEDELLVNGLDGNTIAEDGTLFVQSSKGKEAHYRCTAKNDAGTDHVEYTVKTISAPVLTKDGSRVMNATESEPVVITCDVEGDSPTIHWQKNGVTVATTSNVGFNDDKTTLSFQGVKLNDEGEYTCVATNSAGNVTQQIQLYVGGDVFIVL